MVATGRAMKGAERFILVSQRRLTEDSGGACLLKTPEDRESLEIFVRERQKVWGFMRL